MNTEPALTPKGPKGRPGNPRFELNAMPKKRTDWDYLSSENR